MASPAKGKEFIPHMMFSMLSKFNHEEKKANISFPKDEKGENMNDEPPQKKIRTDLFVDKTIHEAALSGDVDVVRRLLDADVDINCRNSFRETPLHLASSEGKVAVIEVLLEKGALINARNSNEETPLHLAVDKIHIKSVEVLLSNGADINAQDKKARTPLHIAVKRSNDEITHLLQSTKQKLNLQKDGKKLPRLTEANYKVIKILINHGSDLYDLNNSGSHAAYYACYIGYHDILETLLEKKINVNFVFKEKKTLLHLAAENGHKKIVDLLISNRADIDMRDINEFSPVLLAAFLGYSDIVVKLLESGANPYHHEGLSVLHAAANFDRIDTLQSVVTKCSDKVSINSLWMNLTAEDVANISGCSDSFWWLKKQSNFQDKPTSQLSSNFETCKKQYEQSGSTFVQKGKNEHEQDLLRFQTSVKDSETFLHFMDQSGDTILHVAIRAGNESKAKILIENGALVTARNYKDQKPVDLAEKPQKYAHLTKYNIQDCRHDAFLHALLLNVISRTVGNRIDDIDTQTRPHLPQQFLDRRIQESKVEITKTFSKLMSKVSFYDPIGSCGSHILPLAITTNNRRLLPMILASGCPLTTIDSGLGIVQLAWLTEDITIWVSMVVTRAVINQLKFDLEKLPDFSDMDSHVKEPLLKLCDAIHILINYLEGSKPWEAEFECPDGVTPTQLYVTASLHGATLTAWYIWRAGANSFEKDTYSRCNALEAALSSKRFSTAFRLVVDMGANPFLKNKDGEVSIDIFPDEMRLLEVMLGKDYRILERKMEKNKDENEKKELQQIILILIVLFLQYKLNPKSDKWMFFLRFLLDAHSRIKEEELSYPSTFWMVSLEKILLGVEVVKCTPVERYPYLMSEPLYKTLKKIDLINEDDPFCSLFHIIYTNFSDPQCSWYERSERRRSKYFTSSLELLFQKGLKYACEEEASLLLHLLISVAGMPFAMELDDLCETVPLHHAALKGSVSAVVYLLECGASPSVIDASGISPVQYAFMFGHKITANMLIKHLKGNDSKELDYKSLHNSYLRLYGLGPNENVESRHCPAQLEAILIKSRLGHIGNEWRRAGVEKAVHDILVDFQDGEAREIKTYVIEFLSELNKEISSRDFNFVGKIQLVGSSEDNVRLHCPDEFDCNLILSNIRAGPAGEVKADLVDLDDEKAVPCGHQKKLEVQVLKEELKGFIDGTEFLNRFYDITRQSLMKRDLARNRLKIMMPGIKKTQVGVQMYFLWTGKEYPMLFVNIDFVPTVKAPWPDNLPKPNCRLCSCSLNEIYLNKIDKDEWRLSFGSKETMLMQRLPKCKRTVFLTCKMILASLKTENWVPHKIKAVFKYWNGRMFSLPSNGGFALKNCFFQELEEVTDDEEWSRGKLLKRTNSIFKRMCNIRDHPEDLFRCPRPVKAYFGGDTEKASFYSCAPEILDFLKTIF